MNYPHECEVYEIEHDKDPYLATNTSDELLISNLSCWVQPETVEETLLQERESVDITHILYCPVEDIDTSNKIKVTTGPYEDFWYDIVSVKNEAGMDHHLKIEMKKVT